MSEPPRTSPPAPTQEPGHYGAGYGEQVPEDAPPQLGPTTDGDRPPGLQPERQHDRPGSDAASAGDAESS